MELQVAQEKKRAEKANTRLAESKNEVAVSQKILTQLQETIQTREEEHEDTVRCVCGKGWPTLKVTTSILNDYFLHDDSYRMLYFT